MSLILVNENELAVGVPAPWTLYDAEHQPLLREGEPVRDTQHKIELLNKGAFREMSWQVMDEALSEDESPIAESPAVAPAAAGFTFDDMKLRVEDRLQLEPPAKLARERILVKVVGFLRGVSLMVTTPQLSSGQRLQLLENEQVILRSFSGKNAFAFACTVIRANKLPFEYLHLSFPENIQGLAVRKTARVKTRIIATIQSKRDGTDIQTPAIISDISASGVSLESKYALGDKGDMLNLAFRVHLHSIEAFLSVKGAIRAVLPEQSSELNATPDYTRYGIEFQELQPNDSVILQSMIYQQMIENPQKLT